MSVTVGMTVTVRMIVSVPLMSGIKDMNPPTMALIIMLMMHMAVPVSAGLRLEPLADPMHMTAETFDHGLQHMVGQQAQKTMAYLQGYVPIADVVRNPRQSRRIVRMDFQQFFSRSLHGHDPTVRQQQPVGVTDQRADRQIDPNLFAAQQRGTKPRALSELETQFQHRIGRTVASGERLSHGNRHRSAVRGQNRK